MVSVEKLVGLQYEGGYMKDACGGNSCCCGGIGCCRWKLVASLVVAQCLSHQANTAFPWLGDWNCPAAELPSIYPPGLSPVVVRPPGFVGYRSWGEVLCLPT